jgi:ClpX C4-type zinc finger
MAAPMVCFEISANGKLLSRARVGEGDQFEAALAKPIGDRDPTLSVTVFAVRSRDRNRNISWETDQLAVGDEIVIRVSDEKEETEPYIKSVEDLEEEKQSAFFCSFCGKGDREVNSMIAGKENVFICSECVDLASNTFKTEKN